MARNRQSGFDPLAFVRRCRTGTRSGRQASLSTLILVAVVSGCATHSGDGRSDDLVCNSAQQCRVKVEVTCAPGCRASVDHPRVFARGHDVVWSIANKPGQSYVFRTQGGVAFKTEAGMRVFRCHVEANGNRYACRNQRARGTYEYGIQLDGSPAVPLLDPWVVN